MAEETKKTTKTVIPRSLPEGINRIAVNVKDKELIEVSSSSKMINKQTKESLTAVKNSAVDTLKVSKSSDKYLRDILKSSRENNTSLNLIKGNIKDLFKVTKDSSTLKDINKINKILTSAKDRISKGSVDGGIAIIRESKKKLEEKTKEEKVYRDVLDKKDRERIRYRDSFTVKNMLSSFKTGFIEPLEKYTKDMYTSISKSISGFFDTMGGPFALFGQTVGLLKKVVSPLLGIVLKPIWNLTKGFFGNKIKQTNTYRKISKIAGSNDVKPFRNVNMREGFKYGLEDLKLYGKNLKSSYEGKPVRNLGGTFIEPTSTMKFTKRLGKENRKAGVVADEMFRKFIEEQKITNKILSSSEDYLSDIKNKPNEKSSSSGGFFSNILSGIGSILLKIPELILKGFSTAIPLLTKALSTAIPLVTSVAKNLLKGAVTLVTGAGSIIAGGAAATLGAAAIDYKYGPESMKRTGDLYSKLYSKQNTENKASNVPINQNIPLNKPVIEEPLKSTPTNKIPIEVSKEITVSEAKSKKATMESVKPLENPYDSKILDALLEIKNEISKISNVSQPSTNNVKGSIYGFSVR